MKCNLILAQVCAVILRHNSQPPYLSFCGRQERLSSEVEVRSLLFGFFSHGLFDLFDNVEPYGLRLILHLFV